MKNTGKRTFFCLLLTVLLLSGILFAVRLVQAAATDESTAAEHEARYGG